MDALVDSRSYEGVTIKVAMGSVEGVICNAGCCSSMRISVTECRRSQDVGRNIIIQGIIVACMLLMLAISRVASSPWVVIGLW